MIEAYKNNYDLYYNDQMTKFESFEGQLYKEGIEATIDHIFKKISMAVPVHVLDFCCGDGTSSELIREYGYYVHGIDGNKRKIEKAREDYPAIPFSILDGNSFTQDCRKRYDIIYASHCFEHFLKPINLIKELVYNSLNEMGEIIMILPYPNEESEGHPGSAELKLNKSVRHIKTNLQSNGLFVRSIEQVNFRDPEIIIKLQ